MAEADEQTLIAVHSDRIVFERLHVWPAPRHQLIKRRQLRRGSDGEPDTQLMELGIVCVLFRQECISVWSSRWGYESQVAMKDIYCQYKHSESGLLFLDLGARKSFAMAPAGAYHSPNREPSVPCQSRDG